MLGAGICLAASAIITGAIAAPAQEIKPKDILTWERQSFLGHTDYALETISGEPALVGTCKQAASGLFRNEDIDLSQTPVLEWSWGVDHVFRDDADERSRAGDDFPVRLYVIYDGGVFFWRTRAINYVWSTRESVGADWPNPFTAQSHMVVVTNGPPDPDTPWQTHRRNIREDFKRYHNMDLDTLDAIAVMTDCDNRRSVAKGWFGSIRLLAE